MFSLGKTCVKNVHSGLYKCVGSIPQLPHQVVGNQVARSFVHKIRKFYPGLLPTQLTHLSTRKIAKITDKRRWLYPLSTLPTITTTIYINRRGTAA